MQIFVDLNIIVEHYFHTVERGEKDQWTFFKASIIPRDNSLGRETRKNHLCYNQFTIFFFLKIQEF